MKKSDIIELYSIDTEDGVTILIKRDIDKYVESCGEYSYTPDLLVNPKIMILDNGTLTFTGATTLLPNFKYEPEPLVVPTTKVPLAVPILPTSEPDF